MTIPSQSDIGKPLIELLSNNKIIHYDKIEKKLIKYFELTDEEKNTQKQSGHETILHNRIRWSVFYLEKAGLISRPKKGYAKITPYGMNILKTNPVKINYKFLNTLTKFSNWIHLSKPS